jgi:O-antigen/teichoic acid export membrane protein
VNDQRTSIASDAALSLAARIGAIAASAVTAFAVAAKLAPSEYGAYAIAAGLAAVLVIASDIGLSSSAARFIAQGMMNGRLLRSIALLRFTLAGIAAVVLAVIHELFSETFETVGPLLLAAAALLMAQATVAFLQGVLPSLRRIKLLAAVSVLAPIAELAFVLTAVHNNADARDVLIASASGLAIVGIGGLAILAVSPPAPDADRTTPAVRTAARYGITVFGVTLTMAVFGQIDQFVIGAFHDTATVAPYALAVKCLAFLIGPSVAIASVVAPRVARAAQGDRDTFDRWFALMCVLFLGAVTVVAALGEELVTAINPAYRDDWLILAGLCPFAFMMCVAALPTMALTMLGGAGRRVKIAVSALGLNLALDLALIPSLEAWGAVISTTAAFTYYFVAHLRAVRHDLGAVHDTVSRAHVDRLLVLACAAAAVAAAAARIVATELGGADHPLRALLIGGAVGALLHVGSAYGIWRRIQRS